MLEVKNFCTKQWSLRFFCQKLSAPNNNDPLKVLVYKNIDEMHSTFQAYKITSRMETCGKRPTKDKKNDDVSILQFLMERIQYLQYCSS